MLLFDKYINSLYKPSTVKTCPWLYHINEKYDDQDYSGKWLLFYKKGPELDKNWIKIKRLYDNGKLIGVHSLSVSTGYNNSRARDDIYGVIVVYCGPVNDKEKIMNIGNNLLDQMNYENNNGYIYYKSHYQTINGTRSTGSYKNWVYNIKIDFDYSFV